jgi:uncharacterized repeat protein (TIGR04076 family)
MAKGLNSREHPVRITVLKKHFHREFAEKYTANPEDWTECKHFEVGQEFMASKEAPWEMPEGFCGWAWADIQKLVLGMARGGTGRVRHVLHGRLSARGLQAGEVRRRPGVREARAACPL